METIKQFLKQTINYEIISSCLFSSLGYGFGMVIPKSLGYSETVSLISCLVAGIAFEVIAGKIIKHPIFKTFRHPKTTTVMFMYSLYLIGWFISIYLFKHDLDTDLITGFEYIFLISLITFVVQRVREKIKSKKQSTNE